MDANARYQQEQSYNVLRGILKMHRDFRGTTENADITLRMDFANENLAVLKTRYELDAIAGTGDDLSKALNLLFWVCSHVRHKGNYDNHVPMNSLALLEYAYDKGAEEGINCLNLSFILTEALLSIGLPARTVGIYPLSPYDNDNHVVTHVYIAGLDKWLMLDPTWCSYFKDADGNILDVFEIRTALADGRDVSLNDEFAYNGEKLITNSERVQFYIWYMAKNLFYFDTDEISAFGRDAAGRGLYVCPVGFNLFERRIYGIEHRIKLARTDKDIDEAYIESSTRRLESMRAFAAENEGATDKAYFYLSLEDFLARPDLEGK